MKRILVVGDIIEDVYRSCYFKKMCPDAPEAMALIESSVEMRPGGAANVALNVAALAPDCVVDLIGVISSDLAVKIKQLSVNRINMDHSFVVYDGGQLRKERICKNGEVVVRIDNRLLISSFARERIGQRLREYLAVHDPDLVVMSDYGSGTLYERSDDTNLQIILSMRDRLLVDTKIEDLSMFDGSLLAKLNLDEWKQVILRGDYAPERYFKYFVVTKGGEGATLAIMVSEGSRTVTHTLETKGYQTKVVDVCGCGDTFLAGLAAMLIRNSDPFTAVQFANAAASTVVSQPRTSVADRDLTMKLLGRTE